MSNQGQSEAQDKVNVRYEWNKDYRTWEIFSETGDWLGLSAAPKPSPSRLKLFDESLAEGILDLTEFDDDLQEHDLDGMPTPRSSMNAEALAVGVASVDYEDHTTPKASQEYEDETFTAVPPGAPKFGYDLMAANSSSLGRDPEIRKAYGKTRVTKAPEIGNGNQLPVTAAHFMDSSSPLRCDNGEAMNTLEQTSRDLSRADEESTRETLKRRRSVGNATTSHEAESPMRPGKRSCTSSRAALIEDETDVHRTKDYPFLTSFDVKHSAMTRPPPGSIWAKRRMRTSFHVDPDQHPALTRLEPRTPLDPPEHIPTTTTGAQRGTPRAVEDTLIVPTEGQPRRSFPGVTITPDDLRTYSTTVCRSLADGMREQRVINIRRELWSSMFEGYKKWRREGKLEEWRERRGALTAAERAYEAKVDAEMLEMESCALFDGVKDTGMEEQKEAEQAVAPPPDEPLPSIEEEVEVLHPPEEPSDGYRRWGKQWHNISDQ